MPAVRTIPMHRLKVMAVLNPNDLPETPSLVFTLRSDDGTRWTTDLSPKNYRVALETIRNHTAAGDAFVVFLQGEWAPDHHITNASLSIKVRGAAASETRSS